MHWQEVANNLHRQQERRFYGRRFLFDGGAIFLQLRR